MCWGRGGLRVSRRAGGERAGAPALLLHSWFLLAAPVCWCERRLYRAGAAWLPTMLCLADAEGAAPLLPLLPADGPAARGHGAQDCGGGVPRHGLPAQAQDRAPRPQGGGHWRRCRRSGSPCCSSVLHDCWCRRWRVVSFLPARLLLLPACVLLPAACCMSAACPSCACAVVPAAPPAVLPARLPTMRHVAPPDRPPTCCWTRRGR